MQHNYFHLGMSKTASTYLQVYVFPNIPEIKFIRKHNYHLYKTDEPEGKKLLFSNEKDRNIKKEIAQIKEYRPDSKIIIVFREHFDWIKSKYKYYIRKFGHRKFSSYYNGVLIPELGMHEMYYSDIIKTLNEAFPNRCLFMTYKMFKKEPVLFYSKLHSFLGTETNTEYAKKVVKPAFSNRQLYFIRRFNRIYKYKPSKHPSRFARKVHYKYREFLLHIIGFFSKFIPSGHRSVDKELNKEKEKIRNRFREDWQKVEEYAYR